MAHRYKPVTKSSFYDWTATEKPFVASGGRYTKASLSPAPPRWNRRRKLVMQLKNELFLAYSESRRPGLFPPNSGHPPSPPLPPPSPEMGSCVVSIDRFTCCSLSLSLASLPSSLLSLPRTDRWGCCYWRVCTHTHSHVHARAQEATRPIKYTPSLGAFFLFVSPAAEWVILSCAFPL